MTKLQRALIAWFLITTGYTAPIFFIIGELKIWFKVWIAMVVMVILIASGLWLLGVR